MAKGKQNLNRTIDADPPGDLEVKCRELPETFEGIQYQIGRLVKYVQLGCRDPLIIEAARLIAAHWTKMVEEMSRREGNPISAHDNHVIQLEAIDIWCRHHFCYVNDPDGIEVIQTPRRELKATKVPREVLVHVMEPFYAAMELDNPGAFHRSSYEPPPLYIGDCDEALALELAMCASLGISPVYFRFGGQEDKIHHIWGMVEAGGRKWDVDLTNPEFGLGDYDEFPHYEYLEVEL